MPHLRSVDPGISTVCSGGPPTLQTPQEVRLGQKVWSFHRIRRKSLIWKAKEALSLRGDWRGTLVALVLWGSLALGPAGLKAGPLSPVTGLDSGQLADWARLRPWSRIGASGGPGGPQAEGSRGRHGGLCKVSTGCRSSTLRAHLTTATERGRGENTSLNK